MKERRYRQSGFTLLEVIVAMAIFAAMYVIAQQFFNAALRNRDVLQEHAQTLEKTQRALIFLTMDMEQAIARPVRDSFGDVRPAVEGTDTAVSLTRLGWANPLDLRQRSNMQRVTWILEENRLLRRYNPVLDLGVGAEPVETVMIEGVSDFQVRYLQRGPGGDWEWIPRWPDGENAALEPLRQPMPRSLEITVELEDGGGLHRYFRLVENPWS